ncbi:elongin A, like isoform X2 [Rhincodon typus]|uniref:elongin A, like isoform X2 n=1 Tax=Rhincodon typus TaxID=259920 RepID=UPI00202E3CA2|nr:elongin A, like isoform X2 [Rhincodon typus]
MAEEIVQKVLQLKERLLGVSDSNKILKLLKKLQDLNITVDILVETGIGKTVNGFRKNDAVGDLAKELVCQWKKLIPQETSRNCSEQNERKRNNDHSSFRRKDTNKNTNKSSGPSRQEGTLHETDVNESAKLLSQEGNPKKKERSASNQYPKINPYQLKSNECQPLRMDSKECCQDASKNNFLHHQQPLKKFQKPVKSKSLPKDESKFSRKDKKSTDVQQKKKHNEDQYEKESSIESSSTSTSVSQENPCSAKDTPENSKEQLSKSVDKTKHSKLASKVQKCSSKDKSQGMSHMIKESNKVCKVEDISEFEKEEFEKPTMTFESYLNYDEPKRKAKRTHTNKNSSISGKGKDSKLVSTRENEIVGDFRKESKKRRNTDRRDQNEEDIWLETPNKKGKIDINTLLDIPLPKFLPDVTDMPSDSPPTSPIKKSAMSNISESTVEFTGRRLNCKMQVYSGSKTTNIMKMMSLYEQCIRVLQNNIDSIHEVGGVPFEIIEPVLGRCTPEQLFRIEECNPSFIEQSSHFWMKHCKKDFKNEEPQEYESWRELYLRLHDEREQKLKILTQSISSAHANKPKGRQVKLAYVTTSAKPPRDILRQQGKHRTSCSALLNSPFGKNKKKFVAGTECSSFAGGSACSDRPKANSGCVAPNSYSGPDAKRHVKKVAPMMAKSLRAFKNRLGPR